MDIIGMYYCSSFINMLSKTNIMLLTLIMKQIMLEVRMLFVYLFIGF